MKSYRVSVHDDRGITMSMYNTGDTAMTDRDVLVEAWMRFPGADHIFVSENPRRDGPYCTRCGSSRAACGGESDPHE